MRIPLDQIDPHALLRDRSLIDANAFSELKSSIAATGLRQPIEVFATESGYGLLSGYRRLAAFRALQELTGDSRYAEIDAILREPADRQAALAAMVEENDIRQPLSPWEKAAIATASTQAGLFDSLDSAFNALYPYAARQKRAKLRAVAEVIESLEHALTDPETLSETRLLRIAAVLRLGWSDVIATALTEGDPEPAAQWRRLAPVLEEAESLVARRAPTRPDRPRRILRCYKGTVIRRERTRKGFVLHVTGMGADDALMDDVLKEIELLFGPK